ncbi:hypothetical protein JIP62_12670 [Brevundimonas vitis]|uniref:Uncharacterized protein n=1 Tax=Brevundimonas vitisensis TaxID=2800818 RepID=A0ABX7BRL3_9CAUL|nr:hypothetical protein [Brevundimonas vitisensis]QQQ18150.1 hypothetical protein JIP62_12670 [Brevundimonas vitisensis]
MNKNVLIPALALAAASVAVPAAAQSYRGDNWQSINQRQHNLDRRIDQGIRSGQLNRREATHLRAQFNGLLRLEHQYRRGGLTRWERADLDRRFDSLSAQIRYERRDRQRARW